MIDAALMKRFKLDAAQVRGLREEGEAAEAEAIDLFQFTRAIKAAIPHEDRVAILEELWGVILADGVRDPHEDFADAPDGGPAGTVGHGLRAGAASRAGRESVSGM